MRKYLFVCVYVYTIYIYIYICTPRLAHTRYTHTHIYTLMYACIYKEADLLAWHIHVHI